MKYLIHPFALICAISAYSAHWLQAEDWPTYLRSNDRAGATTEQLNLPLSSQWTLSPAEKPTQAWPGPKNRTLEGKKLRRRNTFDDAFQVAVVEQKLYYGSSVDHALRCVDLETGKSLWTFFTEAAIRLAPTVHDGKVYVGSDDGYVYCLNADKGDLVWKLRPGPSDERILGRQQLISRWPVRTGVSVTADKEHGAVAYFGAGVFPHELIYLYAVRASDGKVLWKLDNISQQRAGRNDLSPQGYMLTNHELLVIPSGRTLPGVFDRKNGAFKFKSNHSWRSAAGGVVGGTQALLADDQIYSWGAHHILAMNQKDGKVGFGWFAGRQMAVKDKAAFVANGKTIARIDRQVYAENSRIRHKLEGEKELLFREIRGVKDAADKKKIQDQIREKAAAIDKIAEIGFIWKTPSTHQSRLIIAGNTLFAGGKNEVSAFDLKSGKQTWTAKVDGDARGLAVANGKLIVSTTTGDVVCFSSKGKTQNPHSKKIVTDPFPKDELSGKYAAAAEAILATTSAKKGFCLVLGNEDGRLAWELANRSDLEIYAVEPDGKKVAAARERLTQAGYYGNRITIHHGPLSDIPYPNYFANLVVSDTLIKTGKLPVGFASKDIAHCIKPLGGVIALGPTADSNKTLSQWLKNSGLGSETQLSEKNKIALLTRGALPGAGSWSHQYGEAGNTATSYDYRIKGGLGVLWYGDPGEDKVVNRHDGAVSPLAINGRLIVQGEDTILAYDAYNGLFLWERSNPKSIRTGVFNNVNPGNLVASDDSLFFMEENICYQIDAATGKEIAAHLLPEEFRKEGGHQWGYVSYRDGILFGAASVRNEAKIKRRGRRTDDQTDGIFAIDVKTGKHLWAYRGSKTIEHQTIAIGDDAVYFIDSSITGEQRQTILRQDKSKFQDLDEAGRKKAEAELKNQDLRLAIALNSRTGEKLWEKAVDVTDCSEIGIGGGKLTLLFRNNVLLLCGANANGHYWTQFMAGEFAKRRLLALSGGNGNQLWVRDGNYRNRPIIVDDQIIAEPWSYDLYTGKQKMRKHPITGKDEPWSIMRDGHHCGMIAGTPNMLTFRSRYTSFYDLNDDIGAKHFSGHRTGCWINAIPGNGLISVPESSAGCVCLFSISSTIVMEPRADRKDWHIASSVGAKTPVKELHLNFGAPGDRRAADGTAWIAYPRPRPERKTSLDLEFNAQVAFEKGGGYVTHNADNIDMSPSQSGQAPNWVYASWGNGVRMSRIPLLGKSDTPAKYTVRIHMAAPETKDKQLAADQAVERHFNLRLQGKVVADNIQILPGEQTAQVLEFKGIEVTDVLKLEQFSKTKNPTAAQMPVLNGVEILREG
ncbi:MAG: PQQ-binding-like beta-propeller repeat protein [Verrucomicrobiota bacterium]